MQPYRELLLWQTAMELAEVIYRHTGHFPGDERVGLAAELRRSARLIPSHIAENYDINIPTADFLKGLGLARHTLLQLEIQALLAHRLRYWPPDQFAKISQRITDIQRHVQAFFNSLSTSSN